MTNILDPGFELTLRPMKYPVFYDMYRDAIKNTWTVDEVDFSLDLIDLRSKVTEPERHLIQRLVAFFATGDSIVSNNLVLNLYKHINSPEARMYLSRQLYEEALHVQFYLTLLDTYITDPKERNEAFAAVHNIPSIKAKADFCFKWIESVNSLDKIRNDTDKKQFLLNLICFAGCIEGLFFFAAFAYVYFLRSKGLLSGLASGTNWVFRDESCVVPGTQILTKNSGWINIEDYDEKEEIAQFDMETEEVSWTSVLRTVNKEYEGDLVTFESTKGGIHQSITSDHDVVQKWDSQDQWSKQEAGDFVPNGKKLIPTGGKVLGKKERLTNEERFLIALQADGTMPSSRYTGERSGALPVGFNLTKPRKVERLTSLLTELGWAYSLSSDGEGRKSFRVKVPLSVNLSKKLDWVTLGEVNSTWCEEFLEEVSHWDGHKRKTKGSFQYNNTDLEACEIIQTAAHLCGKTASLSHRTERYHGGTSYVVHVKSKNYIRDGKGLNKTTKPYSGMVHCVTVPTGAILIKSKDKISVTGNCHMEFAFEVIKTVRKEEPHLFDEKLRNDVIEMMDEAIECEMLFAEDLLSEGVSGLPVKDMREYLQFCADQRLGNLGMKPHYGSKQPFDFMELQDVQELANFFERRVSAYQVAVEGEVSFEEEF